MTVYHMTYQSHDQYYFLIYRMLLKGLLSYCILVPIIQPVLILLKTNGLE